MITSKTKICLIIGDPVEHSLSPIMHNAAYKALGIDNQYAFSAATVTPTHLEKAINGIRTLGVRGVSCTIPHKVAVMKLLDKIDPMAQKIGAVNTIVNNEGTLIGYNTDWLGVAAPLEKITLVKGKRVALIGAGGSARAIAYAITKHGGKLTIFNRTGDKGQSLADDFKAAFRTLSSLPGITDYDIIINSTPVGMAPETNKTPIPKEYLRKHHLVFDIVYSPQKTRLLREAREVGATTISGLEMLLHQGIAQFELYTGHKAPEKEMREALLNQINGY